MTTNDSDPVAGDEVPFSIEDLNLLRIATSSDRDNPLGRAFRRWEYVEHRLSQSEAALAASEVRCVHIENETKRICIERDALAQELAALESKLSAYENGADAGIWRCSNCGEIVDPVKDALRWNGETYEHCCSGNPQIGCNPCRWFGKGDPPNPFLDTQSTGGA